MVAVVVAIENSGIVVAFEGGNNYVRNQILDYKLINSPKLEKRYSLLFLIF